jgi:hypothetical protein
MLILVVNLQYFRGPSVYMYLKCTFMDPYHNIKEIGNIASYE